MAKKIIKDLKRNETLFTKTSNYGYITEDENKNVLIEQKIYTYKVQDKKDKLIIWRLERKEKPKRVKTFKKTKNLKNSDMLIDKIHNDKIILREKFREKRVRVSKDKRSSYTLVSTQSNYKTGIKAKGHFKHSFQLIGIAICYDERRSISATLLCHSRKYNFLHKKDFDKAYEDLFYSAFKKFCVLYGNPLKSGDVTIIIEQYRYKYFYINQRTK